MNDDHHILTHFTVDKTYPWKPQLDRERYPVIFVRGIKDTGHAK